jgi:threonyl-tRNA synthetase
VLAEAVQELFPGTQVTIGPVIENGFYYDFARDEPFTPDDLPKIEEKMREIIKRNAPFTKEVWSREQAKAHFKQQGEAYKVELVDMIPEGEDVKIYRQGDWLDLCRGPHMTATGQIGDAFKLMKLAGAYWRGDSATTRCCSVFTGRHLPRRSSLPSTCTRSRKRKSAITGNSAARWTCSISRKRHPVACSGTRRAGRCSRR